ncbi:hypothetical protein SDRG_04283 [Saprolegnia diclina VS20]|uniref:Uncharacterized protein n=1 Tax=Saprolegnia diclina (strain VS20) TaxID=1156394 RepID=T0QX24_SAPDV|nr:hypothetical protein SDRG_04283 [Saprolegnia diclina VS20]EQC38580.1 hypothetical protein SDRG_04283 [Saprolegnia diclina VS20]|eukprot:XP_008608172.1 hypothetical protein SDRG_04283 [Saprolegnia diclina VS20]
MGKASDECPCRKALLRKSIFTAAQDGDLDHVRSFFECHKAHLHVDFPDDFGYTSLHYAAQWDRVDVVAYLFQKGASVDARACGATPLHRAAFRGSVASVRLLLAHGADANLPDTSFGDLRTALHKAASEGHDDIVALLLSAQADPTARDATGKLYADCRAECTLLRTTKPDKMLPRDVAENADVLPDEALSSTGLACSQCHRPSLVIVRTPCCRFPECEPCHELQRPCACCGTISNRPNTIAMELASIPEPHCPSSQVPLRPVGARLGGLFNLKRRTEQQNVS